MADRKKRGRGGKVIHVDFGGRGRVAAPPVSKAAVAEALTPIEPVTDVFTAAEVAKLTGLPATRLRTLAKAGVVAPSGTLSGRPAYTFRDLIVVRTVQGLLSRDVRMKEVAAAVKALATSLPRVTRPLAELRIVSDGRRVIVRAAEGAYEPLTGQMVLDFETKGLRDDVVKMLRPATQGDRQRVAFELYSRASEKDEDKATMEEAESLYLRAIELDPTLAIAYTNLGNIEFRRGNEARATRLYRDALAIDPEQPEAQYNLGYVLLDRGKAGEALPYFEGAVRSDGDFADAHFYLAMTFESLGRRDEARPSWKRYLELEPKGTWSDIARRHL
jgi:DNA-binding transcriptional MerR regulator